MMGGIAEVFKVLVYLAEAGVVVLIVGGVLRGIIQSVIYHFKRKRGG